MVTGEYSLHDGRISEQMKSKVYVFSDSVLCLGEKCPELPHAARIWDNDHIKYFVEPTEYRQLHGLAGEPMEIVWGIYGLQKRA